MMRCTILKRGSVSRTKKSDSYMLYHLATTWEFRKFWRLIRSMIHETNAGDRRTVINLQDKTGTIVNIAYVLLRTRSPTAW